jgi:proteasome lid subunit RPN8/RPN11
VPHAVTIAPEVHAALLRAHRAAGTREFAGALAGRTTAAGAHVARYAPLANAAAGADRFRVDPHAFVRALDALERDGARWLGFVHGHPRGPAAPSAVDAAELWRDCLHLIVGAATGCSGHEVRGFHWSHGGFREVPLRVAAGAT